MVDMKCFESKEQWLEARKSRIGGSDAGVVAGMSKYKTPVTLWREKVGFKEPDDLSDNKAVMYGSNAEEFIRELFKLDHPEYGIMYHENNMWRNSDYEFAHASLDGWLLDNENRYGVLEIKTTEIQNNIQWDEWEDKIPDTYYCQLLHCMAVTDFKFAVLVVQIKYHTKDGEMRKMFKEYKIERSDVEEDIKFLMNKEKDFYNCIQTKTIPAMPLPRI